MQSFSGKFSTEPTYSPAHRDETSEKPPRCSGPSSGAESSRSDLRSRYVRLKILTQKMNIAITADKTALRYSQLATAIETETGIPISWRKILER